MTRYLVDTNVIVSGILTGEQNAPTARILDSMLAGRIPFLISVELLTEYREVLLRPKIRQRHRLSETEIDQVLTDLAANGIPIGSRPEVRREGDDYLRWVLESDTSAILITGDSELARPLARRARSPRAFVDENRKD